MTLTNWFVLLQAGTFTALACLLYREGNWKLAAAQALLAVITWLVYA